MVNNMDNNCLIWPPALIHLLAACYVEWWTTIYKWCHISSVERSHQSGQDYRKFHGTIQQIWWLPPVWTFSKVSTVKMVCDSDKGTDLADFLLDSAAHLILPLPNNARKSTNPSDPIKMHWFCSWCEWAHSLNSGWKSTFLFLLWPLIKVSLSSFVLISYTYFCFFFYILLLHMDVLSEVETDWSIVVFSLWENLTLTCGQDAWDLYHIQDVL